MNAHFHLILLKTQKNRHIIQIIFSLSNFSSFKVFIDKILLTLSNLYFFHIKSHIKSCKWLPP
jgi:hypothetical protein